MKLSEGLRLGIPADDPVCIAINWLALIVIVGVAALSFPQAVRNVFAAQDRTPASPIRVRAITMEPKTAPNGALISLKATGHIQRVDILPNGEMHVETIGSVEVDLIREQGEVSVSGNKKTYHATGTAVYQILMQEWADRMNGADPQPPSALPESRVRRVK